MSRPSQEPEPPPAPKPGDTIRQIRPNDPFKWVRSKVPPPAVKTITWEGPPPAPPNPGDTIEDERKIDSFKRWRR